MLRKYKLWLFIAWAANVLNIHFEHVSSVQALCVCSGLTLKDNQWACYGHYYVGMAVNSAKSQTSTHSPTHLLIILSMTFITMAFNFLPSRELLRRKRRTKRGNVENNMNSIYARVLHSTMLHIKSFIYSIIWPLYSGSCLCKSTSICQRHQSTVVFFSHVERFFFLPPNVVDSTFRTQSTYPILTSHE